MARKNIFDDINDLLNTDMSPGQRGDTKDPKYGDYNYRTILPFGERGKPTPKKNVAPRDPKKEVATKLAKKAKDKIGRKRIK